MFLICSLILCSLRYRDTWRASADPHGCPYLVRVQVTDCWVPATSPIPPPLTLDHVKPTRLARIAGRWRQHLSCPWVCCLYPRPRVLQLPLRDALGTWKEGGQAPRPACHPGWDKVLPAQGEPRPMPRRCACASGPVPERISSQVDPRQGPGGGEQMGLEPSSWSRWLRTRREGRGAGLRVSWGSKPPEHAPLKKTQIQKESHSKFLRRALTHSCGTLCLWDAGQQRWSQAHEASPGRVLEYFFS